MGEVYLQHRHQLDIHNSLGGGNTAGHTGGFVMVTVKSKLTSQFLTLRDQ